MNAPKTTLALALTAAIGAAGIAHAATLSPCKA